MPKRSSIFAKRRLIEQFLEKKSVKIMRSTVNTCLMTFSALKECEFPRKQNKYLVDIA